MKVFLTGATGYLGSAIAKALTAQGHKVIALARSAESESKLAELGFEVVRGDIKDAASVRRCAENADGVIHAASPGDASNAEADDVTVAAVIETLAGSDKPFVYTSGVWVIGNTGGTVADETAAANPTPLVAWRVAYEDKVKAAANRGVRSVVLRPAMVYGNAGGVPAMWLGSARQDGVVRYVGDGSNRWPMVHVDDLADLYVRALTSAPAGSLYLGAAGKAVRILDAAMAASEGAGIPGKVESWPLDQARQVLGPFADALVLDQQVSGEKAKRELGWQSHAADLLTDLRSGSYARKR